MLVREGNARFPPWWDDVVQDEIVLFQKGKVACTRFSPRWYDVV
jgi:hypothetical protein